MPEMLARPGGPSAPSPSPPADVAGRRWRSARWSAGIRPERTALAAPSANGLEPVGAPPRPSAVAAAPIGPASAPTDAAVSPSGGQAGPMNGAGAPKAKPSGDPLLGPNPDLMPELPPLPDAGPAATPAAGKPAASPSAAAAPSATSAEPGGRSATAGPRDGPGRLSAGPAASGGADAPAPSATPATAGRRSLAPPDLGPPSADNRPGGAGPAVGAVKVADLPPLEPVPSAGQLSGGLVRPTAAQPRRPQALVLDPRAARDLAPRRPDPPGVLAEARRRGPGARDPGLLAPGQHDRREGRRRDHHHARPPFGPQRALQAQGHPLQPPPARAEARDLRRRS